MQGKRPYHLEQESALLNLLVPGELLRDGVTDVDKAPRRDHLRQPTKSTHTLTTPCYRFPNERTKSKNMSESEDLCAERMLLEL